MSPVREMKHFSLDPKSDIGKAFLQQHKRNQHPTDSDRMSTQEFLRAIAGDDTSAQHTTGKQSSKHGTAATK